MKRIVSISLCLVFTVMVGGCLGLFSKRGSKVLTVPVANVSDEVAKLERTVSADGVAVNMGYDHPHEFSEEQMRNELGVLVVREYEWGKYGMGNEWVPRPAFTRAATERLIPALVIAFKEASGSDKILFHVPGETGQPTQGEVYIQDGKLIWIFQEVDGHTYLGKDSFMLDSEDWTIEEKPGLSITKRKDTKVIKVVRDLSVAPPEVTAAVVEERLPQPPAAAPPVPVYREVREPVVSPPAEVISPGLKELEKKLQTLKKWQESGLITDEDYDKQKAQILQQLQQL
jgi:hypothetical protein